VLVSIDSDLTQELMEKLVVAFNNLSDKQVWLEKKNPERQLERHHDEQTE
jgi:hypothetical protein